MGVKDVTSDFECIDNHKVYAFLEGLKKNLNLYSTLWSEYKEDVTYWIESLDKDNFLGLSLECKEDKYFVVSLFNSVKIRVDFINKLSSYAIVFRTYKYLSEDEEYDEPFYKLLSDGEGYWIGFTSDFRDDESSINHFLSVLYNEIPKFKI
ncbi:hypothetical protein [Serratia sp. Je.1.23.a]|uniref:hypothetical protein n=1 Tax=Serratia sp. Je.1.23.a TaxID=3142841 RepID=UPI003DA8E127